MEQRCNLFVIYANWLLYLAVAIAFAVTGKYLLLAVWLVLTPVFQIAYVRWFSRLSRFIGYGSVDDEAPLETASAPVDVTLYTAAGCPFCPIVEQRLEALRPSMGFRLTRVDVTMRTDLLSRMKIRAVPVVAVGDRMRVGNLTSRELTDLIAGTPGSILSA